MLSMISLNDPFFKSSFNPENAVPQSVLRIWFRSRNITCPCTVCTVRKTAITDDGLEPGPSFSYFQRQVSIPLPELCRCIKNLPPSDQLLSKPSSLSELLDPAYV